MHTTRQAVPGWRQAVRLLAILPVLCVNGIAAADGPAPPIEVLITESARMPENLERLPFAVTVRNAPYADRQGIGLDESLQTIPGVLAQNRYNAAQDLRISIRGFGTRANFGVRGVKILLDGIPHTLPDGQAQLDSIDIYGIDRIEVWRGPAAALYGNAAGGVVDIRSDFSDEPLITTQAVVGAFGQRAYRFRASSGDDRWGGTASAAHSELDGYRGHNRNRVLITSAQLQLKTQHGDWTMIASALDSPIAQDPGGLTAAEAAFEPRGANARNILFDAGEEVEQQKIGVSYQRQFGATQVLQLRGHGFNRDFRNRLPFSDGGAVALARGFTGAGAQWLGSATTGMIEHRYTAGLDLDHQNDDRRRFDNLQGVIGTEVFSQIERVTSVGLFAQDTIALTQGITVTVGARVDSVKFAVNDRFLNDGDDSGQRKFNHFSPMFGLSWHARENTFLYTNLTTSFETPTTTELANPSGGGFDPDLRPQSAVNYELGLKFHDADLAVTMALFRIRVKDELVPFELPQSPGRSFFRNAGRSTRDGFEADLNWRLHPLWRATLSYTYADYVFDRYTTPAGTFDGNRLPGIPKHLFAGEIQFQHPSGWFIKGDWRYVGSQYADDSNRNVIDSYWLTNLRAGLRKVIDKWLIDIFAGLNNAAATEYFDNIRINAAGDRFFEPAPGRNLYIGAKVTRSFR